MKKLLVLGLAFAISCSTWASISQKPVTVQPIPLPTPVEGCGLNQVLSAVNCQTQAALTEDSEEEGAMLKYVMSQSNLVEKHGYDATVLAQEVEETTQVISAYFKKNPQFKGVLILSTAYLPSYGKPQVLNEDGVVPRVPIRRTTSIAVQRH